MPDNDIHKAFLETNFRVQTKNGPVQLNINHMANELEQVMPHLKSWCFITAWNPLPQILDTKQNQDRNTQLCKDLDKMGLVYHPGVGISKDEKWQEESVLVENINQQAAHILAQKYGQLAYVFGLKHKPAELVYTS